MASNPITHEIELPGGRTLRAQVRSGDGVPVVFLHGMFGSVDSWAEIATSLDRTSISFDLPGFGGSDLPAGSTVRAYAEDLAAGIQALGLTRFELVGHSFGGAVAAEVANLLPGRVVSLLLLAPAGFGRIAIAEALSLPGVRVLADVLVPRLLEHRGVLPNCSRAIVTAARRATDALVASGRARRGESRYAGPVAAVWGTDDRVVRPKHGRDVEAAFPQAEILLWDGMGHHPQTERSAWLVDLVHGKVHGTSARRRARAHRRRIRERLWPLPAATTTPRFA
jgi:pyruvate dehydrogenase E2 component (dihydrolipoamide acetyltransferase)